MPRRHRRDRAASPPVSRPRGMAPAWAQADGYVVREVTGERPYRCPGCHQLIRPGTVHLVVIPDEGAELRRHWHTPCWRSERRAQP